MPIVCILATVLTYMYALATCIIAVYEIQYLTLLSLHTCTITVLPLTTVYIVSVFQMYYTVLRISTIREFTHYYDYSTK